MIFLGFILITAILVISVVWAGATPLLFVDLPSVVIVIFPSILVTLCAGFGKVMGKGFIIALKGSCDMTPEEIKAGVEAFDLMFKASIWSGILGVFLGAVMLLVNLSNPENIGPFMAVALITVVYGIVFGVFLCLPIKAKIASMG